MTSKKKEGDLKTPRGKFKFVLLLYRKDRNNNFHCNIKKKIIKKNMGWCDDPNSESYNKLVNFPFKYKMMRHCIILLSDIKDALGCHGAFGLALKQSWER